VADAIALVRADRDDRVRNAVLLAGLAAWLVYTRVFWTLRASHATLPACPFLTLTGHPCPLCGGSRSFASMWQGDVVAAARYHPLGPLLFLGTWVAVAVLAYLLATGRSLRISLRAEERLFIGFGALFVVVWLFRLAFLPLPA
jgi:predicted ABC-type sugar transport system permease subunit